MKSKLAFGWIIFFAISFSVSAQKNKIRFHSINTFGLVGGESKASTAFQSVNGIQFSNWFSGIGVGVDYYRYKTLPLFIDGRYFFGDDKNGFIYGDLGYNFPMKNKLEKRFAYRYDLYRFSVGIYTDFGIGFQTPLCKSSFLLFSLGYSYKKLEIKGKLTECGVIGPCWSSYVNYEFNLNRMILKAGLVF